MLDDLTPEEVCALVQCVKLAENFPGMPMLVNPKGELTTLEHYPGAISLAKKINEAGKREDVRKYLAENYGSEDE